MRGPGLHVSPDIRRLWRCPACGRERLVGQTETSVVCRCQDPPKFMQLVEGKRVVRPEPRPVARFYEEEDLPPDEIDPNAPPIDPSVQMTPAPRPPRPPRPPRSEGNPSGEAKQGGPRPPRDHKGPPPRDQKGGHDRRGKGPPQARPPQSPAREQPTQDKPLENTETTASSAPPVTEGAAGDKPRKKRRRNRDRNREGGASPGPPAGGEATPQNQPTDTAEEFGAGL